VFPHVGRPVWESRLDLGRVTLSDGTPVRRDTPYVEGETVRYSREVPGEPEAPETETVLYEDASILVADKPHGMPVTPAGDYLARCLLVRLQKRTGNADLVPAHRLDRDTAGVVMFVTDPEVRGAYHRLFSEGRVEREYLAVASIASHPEIAEWRVENRIGRGDPWFRQRIVDGAPNAISEIGLVGRRGEVGLFRIRPRTGRKHQIRLHMAALGYPIIGDPLYPDFVERQDGEPPLQLLARRLSFTDPVDGGTRTFSSERRLSMFPR
jgi:tRNA pseudouridine32 synthase/23S rRNA pseudouridine746 synthase